MNPPLSKDNDEIYRDVLDTLYRVIKIRDGYKLGPEYFASLQARSSHLGGIAAGGNPVAVNKGISLRPHFVKFCQRLSRLLQQYSRRLRNIK